MAKMENLGKASRFALLKIDDDESDEDNPLAGLQNKKPGQGKPRKFVPMGAAANATSQKNNKKKPGKKTKPTEFDGKDLFDDDSDEQKQVQETLRISQATFEAEQQRRRELEAEEDEGTKRALEESSSYHQASHDAVTASKKSINKADAKKRITGSASPPTDRKEKDNESGDSKEEENDNSDIGVIVKTTMDEAKSILEKSGQRQAPNTDQALYSLYKTQFELVATLAKDKEAEMDALKNELVKVKNRNKKFCEVLADSETREKMELVVAKQKLAKLNEELMQQVTDMHTELEQARSRIHELENEQKKHSKGNK